MEIQANWTICDVWDATQYLDAVDRARELARAMIE